MSAEGAVGITAAVLAGSVALLGFGLDSVIEGLASVIVIWRFTGGRRLSEHAEQQAQRLVAITFLLLAPTSRRTRFGPSMSGEHASDQLARDRPVDLKHLRDAATRKSEAPHRVAPRLGRDGRRRHAEHALRLPRRRCPHRPRAQRRVRTVVGRPRRRARDRRARDQRRPRDVARRGLLRPATPSARAPTAPATTTAAPDPAQPVAEQPPRIESVPGRKQSGVRINQRARRTAVGNHSHLDGLNRRPITGQQPRASHIAVHAQLRPRVKPVSAACGRSSTTEQPSKKGASTMRPTDNGYRLIDGELHRMQAVASVR